jgi:hypothetical protein
VFAPVNSLIYNGGFCNKNRRLTIIPELAH